MIELKNPMASLPNIRQMRPSMRAAAAGHPAGGSSPRRIVLARCDFLVPTAVPGKCLRIGLVNTIGRDGAESSDELAVADGIAGSAGTPWGMLSWSTFPMCPADGQTECARPSASTEEMRLRRRDPVLAEMRGSYEATPKGPAWLRRLIGDDYVAVTKVSAVAWGTLTEDDCKQLARFTELSELT